VVLDTLVQDLNRVLFQLKSDGMFATMAALRFHAGGAVEVAVAGHLPVLRVRARTGAVEMLPNEQLPLGILEDTSYSSRNVEGESGDLFVGRNVANWKVVNVGGNNAGNGI
jgi:serine phosphatase RsbU (regulator of sigma subunit)